jgi:pimeloyl-ACP methyl ester carboxylesterase
MLDSTVMYERLMRRWALMQGARSHRVRYAHGSVHALDLPGRGYLPPVVLIHGFSASGATQYLPMVKRLRPHVRRVLLPDLPGHGSSTVPRRLDEETMQAGLEAALDRLLRRPAILFASSLAGGFAVRYASRRPHKVRGLMLCSPGGAPLDDAQLRELMGTFEVDSHRDALDFVDRLFPRPHPLRHAYAWGVRQQFSRPHLRQLLEQARHANFLQPDELGALRMPVHLIWGRADRILPSEHFDYFRRHLPHDTEVETPPGYGHAPFLHRADDLTERLLQFTRKVAARPECSIGSDRTPAATRRSSTPSATSY